MYLETVESFMAQAEDLYRANPARCRYTLKYRDSDGKLVAKMTDNATCLKFKSDKQAEAKKLEQFHNRLFDLMSGLEVDVEMKETMSLQ
jgi:signal recognition particle subunit SRP9